MLSVAILLLPFRLLEKFSSIGEIRTPTGEICLCIGNKSLKIRSEAYKNSLTSAIFPSLQIRSRS